VATTSSSQKYEKLAGFPSSPLIEAILAKYGLQDACSVTTPLDVNIKLQPGETEIGNKSNNYASLIGSLMYAAVVTRPDIAFAVN